MPNDPSPIDKFGGRVGKWFLGTISTITVIVSFVNMMRGNFQLGILIFTVLVTLNLLLGLLYVIFHTKPASSRSKKRIYPYEKYRTVAVAGVVLLVIAVGGMLSMRSNREFIAMAVIGTPTATAVATPTPFPPKTTMLITTNEGEFCDIDGLGILPDVTQRNTLDIGINNNSNHDLMITSLTLKPVWISASQKMGPTSISATYDVSIDAWWKEGQDLLELKYSDPAKVPPETLQRIAQTGTTTWTRPAPIQVKEIIADKFTIKRNSQDRFQLVLGLSQTFEYLWGTLIVEITTDDNQTLTSEPTAFAVCYETYAIPSDPPTGDVITGDAIPEGNGDGKEWFGWNNVGRQDSGGVVVEIPRVTLVQYSQTGTNGEIFFKVQNNTDKPQLLSFRYINITIETSSQYYTDLLISGLGQRLDGYIKPDETKTGSYRFNIDTPLSEIKGFRVNPGCAFNEFVGCSGPEFDFVVDISTPAKDPLPEEIKKLISS